MRVLVADKLPEAAVARMREGGCEVFVETGKKDAALRAAVLTHDAEVLVVRSTQVGDDVMEGSRLGLILRAGAGVNTIDVQAASKRGIYVANCPGKNSLAVAELALGLLVSLDRRIPEASADLRAGRWKKAEYGKARGLASRVMGVVGAGRIGQAVATRCRGLGMDVRVWDHIPELHRDIEGIGCRFEYDLLQMVGHCDALSLHLALSPETRGICDRRFFEAMKKGAIFINTARAELVDEAALADAVRDRGIRAGLDVFLGEPDAGTAEFSHPLLALPGVHATPHIGASTDQAQEAVAEEAVRIVLSFARSGRVPHAVNVNQRSPASHLLVVRHRNRVGVLSHVFAALKEASINVEETENVVFAGAESCIARIAIDGAPGTETLDRIRQGCPEILNLALVPLGEAR
jgi:D-3-phosphoglycerate dehydrogenase